MQSMVPFNRSQEEFLDYSHKDENYCMLSNPIKSFWGIALFSLSFVVNSDTNDSACGASSNFLALVDRPTFSDSVCVVPRHNSVVEAGYQYQSLFGGGNLQTLPQTVYRYGLADQFEVVMLFPSYVRQNIEPQVGVGASTLGVKHQLFANQKWITTIEGLFTFPSGSSAFGSQNPGAVFNGIVSYNISSTVAITGMFGVSSQSESVYDGGQSYTSFSPDLVLSWAKDRLELFIEVYGESKTGPDEGSGFNMDAGVLYLIKKNISLDLEVGQRLTGDLFGFNQYIGAGIAIQFS